MKIFEVSLLGATLLASACGGEHAVVAEAEAIAEKACECKDVACANELTDDMRALAEHVGEAAGDKVSESEGKKVIAAMVEAEDCLKALAAATE